MKARKILALIMAVALMGSFAIPGDKTNAANEYLENIDESDEEPGNLEISEIVAGDELVLSYNLNQEFNGTSTIFDISEDIDVIKSLDAGAISVEFSTESTATNQILFSLSDANDDNSNVIVKLLNGKLRYEVRENGTQILGYTYSDISLNDGETHKVIINNGERGSEIYIDGEKVYTAAGVDKFFNDINTPNSMTIGARTNSTNPNGKEFFQGHIGEVKIYGSDLEVIEGEKLSRLDLALSYNLDRDFNGTSDFEDISNDINSVKDLNDGAILIEFNTDSTARTQTLFSMADSKESNSHIYLMISNGHLRYEVREGGTLKIGYTISNVQLNDGKDHKIMINNGNNGSAVYIDGVKVYSTSRYNHFFNDVMTPDTMTIGAIRNAGYETLGRYFFNGEIKTVDIYNSEVSEAKAIEETTVLPSAEDEYERLINTIHNEDDLNIVFVGDSITHGAAHTNGYRAYVDHVAERIEGEEVNGVTKNETFVINAGASGGTTQDVVNSFDTTITNQNPDIVFLTLGMNDCRSLTISKFEENLVSIIEDVRALGAQIVLQTTNDTRTPRANFPQFMEMVRKVGEEYGVYVIDHYEYWLQNQDKKAGWLNDSIHPNQYGHLEMAKLIMRELQLDTEDSFTYNLQYPLTTAGEFVDKTNVYHYPDYTGIEGVTPLVSYKVDEEINENNIIDISEDISTVEKLEEGTIVARFNLTNNENAQTILSLSDDADRSSNLTLSLNEGKMHYEVRENGNVVKFTDDGKSYNDGEWHTVVLTTSTEGTKLYVDGELIVTNSTRGFFADVNTPDNFNIGKNVDNGGSQWYYNGKISYVDIYSDVLTEEQALLVSAEEEIQYVESMNLDAIKAKISSNAEDTWVFLGDEDTSANGDTYGYRDFTEHFEERVRWELSTSSMIKRRKFMVNAAMDGSTSTEILAKFDELAAVHKPSVVSVMIGGRETVSVDEFENNLRAIVDEIEAIGAVPFLQTPVIKADDVSEYIAVIRKIAEERGVAFIDHYEYWDDIRNSQPQIMGSWLTEDGSPNHRGHLEIATKMTEELGIYGGILSRFTIPYQQ